MRVDTQEVFINEEDKSGWSDGIQAERIEGERRVAIHVIASGLSGPMCSVYLRPVDAAVIATQLLEAAREASGDTEEEK